MLIEFGCFFFILYIWGYQTRLWILCYINQNVRQNITTLHSVDLYNNNLFILTILILYPVLYKHEQTWMNILLDQYLFWLCVFLSLVLSFSNNSLCMNKLNKYTPSSNNIYFWRIFDWKQNKNYMSYSLFSYKKEILSTILLKNLYYKKLEYR